MNKKKLILSLLLSSAQLMCADADVQTDADNDSDYMTPTDVHHMYSDDNDAQSDSSEDTAGVLSDAEMDTDADMSRDSAMDYQGDMDMDRQEDMDSEVDMNKDLGNEVTYQMGELPYADDYNDDAVSMDVNVDDADDIANLADADVNEFDSTNNDYMDESELTADTE